MKLLEFKSGYNRIVCHPDKVDYFVIGSNQTSGVVINSNFSRVDAKEIEELIVEYGLLMDELDGIPVISKTNEEETE